VKLSTFDRIGVAFVTLVGAGLGLMIFTASAIRLTPMLALVFPGFGMGVFVSKFAGPYTSRIVAGVANGTYYGLLLYAWDRLANWLSARLGSRRVVWQEASPEGKRMANPGGTQTLGIRLERIQSAG
jgi:hypothetical protein